MTALKLGIFNSSTVRTQRQTEVAECGLACLAMVASFHGLSVDLGTLRRQFGLSSRGMSLTTIMAIADRMGLMARAVKASLDEVPQLAMPAILHWDLNHFVVIERVKRRKALIHDPASGAYWCSFERLSKQFTGVAVEVQPADDFAAEDRTERLRLSRLWTRMTGLKRALLQTFILSLVLQAFALAAPYYIQIAIDHALPSLDFNLLTVVALGFGLITLINAGVALLRSFVLLSAGTSLAFGLSSNIARRLFRLPIEWFEKRHVGDVLSRFHAVSPIQRMLTEGAVAVVLDGFLAILTLAVMFFYSPMLAVVSLVALTLYVLVRILSFSFQRDAQEASIISGAREQSVLMESLRGIRTLRLFNRESLRHGVWQARLVDSLNARLSLSKVGIWQGLGNSLIFGLENIAIVWLAVGLVMSGGFSVGMVFAFIAYKTQFIGKATSFLDQFVSFRMLNLYLERLGDIALSDEDVSFRQAAVADSPLSGRIELRDICYRYSSADPFVLQGVNLIVEPGDHIAITGRSGCGKSTLVKILLGLIEPTSGEILVDGVPLCQFGYKNFHDQVAGVLQDDSLFAGSLADNIALFDEQPCRDRIISASQAAALHDDVSRMPMAYETLVGDMGSALSGGQKQRVLLARSLYRNPKLLVLDESTSYLDANLESTVSDSIVELGITRVVIAHRQETISRANQVYLMRAGRLDVRDDQSVKAPVDIHAGES